MEISIEELRAGIEAFAQTLSAQPLGLARHQPHPSANPTHCIENVMNITKLYGGSVRYGWYFLHRISPEYGNYLIATHHAVWHNPKDLTLIDVTPYHPEEKHKPISPNGDLLFLVDENAIPVKIKNAILPLPSRFYQLSPNNELKNYVDRLQSEEYEFYKQQYGLKF